MTGSMTAAICRAPACENGEPVTDQPQLNVTVMNEAVGYRLRCRLRVAHRDDITDASPLLIGGRTSSPGPWNSTTRRTAGSSGSGNVIASRTLADLR